MASLITESPERDEKVPVIESGMARSHGTAEESLHRSRKLQETFRTCPFVEHVENREAFVKLLRGLGETLRDT